MKKKGDNNKLGMSVFVLSMFVLGGAIGIRINNESMIKETNEYVSMDSVQDKNENRNVHQRKVELILNEETKVNGGKSDKVNIEKEEIKEVLFKQTLEEYLSELQQKVGDKSYVLLDLLEEDLDQDGRREYIASYGPEGTMKSGEEYRYMDVWLAKQYIFREKDEGFELLEQAELPSCGYTIYEIESIKLKGDTKNYIYVGFTNGKDPLGLGIYKLVNNEIETLFETASPSGSGIAELRGEEGWYDEIYTYRYDYANYFHGVNATYKWNGSLFEGPYYDVELPQYLNEPDAVVYHYIDLLWIEEQYGQSPYITSRINQILDSQVLSEITLKTYVQGIYTYDFQISGEENLQLEVLDNNEGTVVVYATLKDSNISERCCFTLKKNNERWQITQINKE